MSSPGTVVLSHVAKESRPALFSGLINALQPDDRPSIDFVTSAMVEDGDDGTRDLLVTFLQRSIEASKPEAAVSTASKYPKIGASLFARSAAILSQDKSEEQHAESRTAHIVSHLHFCKSTFSLLPASDAQAAVFSASVDLLLNADQSICHAARDLVFAVLASDWTEVSPKEPRPDDAHIWTKIQSLVASNDKKPTIVLGYSLWLRWVLSAGQTGIEGYANEVYWDLLLRGLRKGDTEVRKACLNILKLSLAAESYTVDSETRMQFERYATIFETIVLGRYINQIQECETDLNDLASESSPVATKWLYTLLASALDSQMQDSNRRFIGNWVMRAQVRSGLELVGFLQHDFLPWATQGSLFVASLKRNENGYASCLHGERLAGYIATALKHVQHAVQVRNIVWSYVTSKKTFAYAKVWLLKALTDARPAATSHAFAANGNFAEHIMRGLPDVARDYVALQLKELGIEMDSESASSRRDLLEREAIAQCSSIDSAEAVNDLWSDMDYLEFPKDLLFHIPGALLCNALVDKALTDDELATSLRDKVEILQKVAETKTYLISPLSIAISAAALRSEGAFELLGIEEYIIRAVDRPPEATIDLMLEEATVHLFAKYEAYFGQRPSLGIAALLDLMSRIHDQAKLEDLVNRLLRRWKAQKIPPPTVSTWKTTLQLQALLLCLENLWPTAARAQELLMDLLQILSIEPLPRYRYLLEWMVVRLIQRMQLERTVLDQLASKDHHSNPKYLASLMKIGSIVACSESSGEAFATKLATLYAPLAASSKVVIRHEAQWQVPILLEHARSKGWTAISDNTALDALDDYIRSLERFHEPPLERKTGRFDPETHHTMANLVEGSWFGLDSTEAPLTSRADFVKLYADERWSNKPESCIPLGEAISQTSSAIPSTGTKPTTASPPAPRTIDDVTALQTKGTAYLARTLSDPSDSAARPNDLIVVGSLVDNPYNLGGLSRVSEIFGASALTLQNQNVIGNKDFTSVSVSSHLHFPIVQLSALGVPAFLAERKAEGFTVVGIEQTDRSVILGSEEAMLPEKCVLVVGSEKEGIPAMVLTECDILVEIPQKGVTRSLNVQTAVSVVLFEYTRQHGQRKEGAVKF